MGDVRFCMKKTPASQRRIFRKLPRKYTPFAFAFFMAGIMGFLMSAVIVALQVGFPATYWSSVMKAYVVAMPVAFVCVMFVRPLALRLVALTVDVNGER